MLAPSLGGQGVVRARWLCDSSGLYQNQGRVSHSGGHTGAPGLSADRPIPTGGRTISSPGHRTGAAVVRESVSSCCPVLACLVPTLCAGMLTPPSPRRFLQTLGPVCLVSTSVAVLACSGGFCHPAGSGKCSWSLGNCVSVPGPGMGCAGVCGKMLGAEYREVTRTATCASS